MLLRALSWFNVNFTGDWGLTPGTWKAGDAAKTSTPQSLVHFLRLSATFSGDLDVAGLIVSMNMWRGI